jgi:hypothetical protein
MAALGSLGSPGTGGPHGDVIKEAFDGKHINLGL